MNLQILKNIGLSDGEVKIYQALLEQGEMSAGGLIKKTDLKRGDCYNKIYDLKKKGLVEEFNRHGRKYFRVEPPNEITNLAEGQYQTILSIKHEIDSILPDIISQYNLSNNKPAAYYFEGIDGLKKIYDHVLKIRKPVSIFVSFLDRHDSRFSDLIDAQIKRQAKLGIKVKSLSYKIDYSRTYWDFARAHGIKIKVYESNLQLPAQILIFGDNVAFTSFQESYISTLISNPDIAKSIQTIFDVMWSQARNPKIADREIGKK